MVIAVTLRNEADDIVVVVVEERKMESARQDSRKAECRVRGKFGHKTWSSDDASFAAANLLMFDNVNKPA